MHDEEAFEISTPVPAEAELIGRTRVAAIVDKGADKDALALIERTISEDRADDRDSEIDSFHAELWRVWRSIRPDARAPPDLPNRGPDLTCDAPTLPEAALIYRLSGDYNPLHADPEVARQGGLPPANSAWPLFAWNSRARDSEDRLSL